MIEYLLSSDGVFVIGMSGLLLLVIIEYAIIRHLQRRLQQQSKNQCQ